MQHGVRLGRGPTVVVATVFAVAAASPGVAVAPPGTPAWADREFPSSFEPGEPAPDWLSTVDTTPGGDKRASGVDGGYGSGIPGNVTDHVTDVRAGAENTGGGEVKENLADGEPSTEWPAFEPAGWAEFDLDATPDQLTTLYSSLYRLYLYPNSGFDKVGGTYKYASPFSKMPGPDTPTHTGAKIVEGKVHVDNDFWDIYRTTWPAYSFLTPSKAGELVDGFVQHHKDGGWTSRWSSPGYADLMTGTSSDVAFADAYVKGVGFDAEAAYDAAVKNATVVPPSSGVGRKGMAPSPFPGCTGTETHEGLSWALEGYLNDYGIAKMGEALYEKTGDQRYQEESAYFLDRAQEYANLFDSEAGSFQGKSTKGDWRVESSKYDPRVW